MYKVKMQDGSTKYANPRKHRVGEWYEDYFNDIWYIVTGVEAGEVRGEYGVEKTWLHTLREATAEELAERETKRAEGAALSAEERTAKRLEQIKERVPGLDWG